jgi:exodeoxyribonuclease VII small subunit|tara:strand:- start:7657 stop:7911 length:255 start_codon:yes stop_codon:yes gene_type:complete
MPRKKSFQFEESLAQLEELVEQMEDGDLSLEDSLKAFEKGIKLTRECQRALKQAEQKIELLMDKNSKPGEDPEPVPFEPDDVDA